MLCVHARIIVPCYKETKAHKTEGVERLQQNNFDRLRSSDTNSAQVY